MNPLLFLGGGEIMIILLIVVMFFGSKRIPEIARGLGKGMKEIRHVSNELKREITESGSNMGSSTHSIKKAVDDAGSGLKDIGGSIKKGIQSTFEEVEEARPRSRPNRGSATPKQDPPANESISDSESTSS